MITALIAGAWPAAALAATDPFTGGSNTAGNFAVLAATTVTNTGPTFVGGQVGVAPGTAVTGFPPGQSGVQHKGDATATTAQTDLVTAFNNAAGQPCPPGAPPAGNDYTGLNLGGRTLVPGVYCQTTAPTLTGTLTLNGNGIYIFQIGSTLVTAPGASVVMTAGGSFCQVFWEVNSSATIATSTNFVGNIMALASITIQTGATLNGRALARTGGVTLDTDTIIQPPGCGFAASGVVPTPTPTPVALPNAGGPPQQPGFPWWPLAIAGTGIIGAGLFVGLRKRTQHRDR